MTIDIRTFLGHNPPDPIIADAETSMDRSPEERYAMFCGIQRLLGEIWENFDREEMLRRLRIGEALDPAPDPWWRDIQSAGLP